MSPVDVDFQLGASIHCLLTVCSQLPYRVRWQDLKDLFRRAGTVLRADVSLGPDNRSRGYGTVLLSTAEDAGRAVDMFNGYCWQTRTPEVRPDRLGDDALSGLSAASASLGVSPLGSAPVSGNGTPALASPMGRYAMEEAAAAAAAVDGAGSRPGTSAGQSSRNLFVGNVRARGWRGACADGVCSCRSTSSGKT